MVPNSIKNRDRIRRWTMPCAWSHFEYKIVNRPMVAVVTFERATAPVSVMPSFAYHWKGNWTSFRMIAELLGVNILQQILIWVWSRFFKKKMVIFLFFPSCYISLEGSCYHVVLTECINYSAELQIRVAIVTFCYFKVLGHQNNQQCCLFWC